MLKKLADIFKLKIPSKYARVITNDYMMGGDYLYGVDIPHYISLCKNECTSFMKENHFLTVNNVYQIFDFDKTLAGNDAGWYSPEKFDVDSCISITCVNSNFYVLDFNIESEDIWHDIMIKGETNETNN